MGPWEPVWPSPSACSPTSQALPCCHEGAGLPRSAGKPPPPKSPHHHHHLPHTQTRAIPQFAPSVCNGQPSRPPHTLPQTKGRARDRAISTHPPTRALCKTPTASPFSGYPCAWAIRRPNPHRPVNTSPTRPAGYAKTRHMQGTVCGSLNSFSKRVPLLFNNARLPCMQEAEPSQHDMSMSALPWQPWEQNRGAARAASPTAGLPAPANCIHGWPPAPGHTCSQPFPDQP